MFLESLLKRRKKLRPKELSLVEMAVLYTLVKKQWKFAGGSLDALVKSLYKSDLENFNKVYKIIYSVANTNEEMVAQILLKFGLEYCRFPEFVASITRQVK